MPGEGTPRVLVTGASGFIGTALSRELRAQGWCVRGLFRGETPPGWSGEAARVNDLHDRPAVAAALAGTQAVVHLASRVHVMRDTATDPLQEFRRTNVEGTAVLLEEALRADVQRVVFGSSVKAMGESTDVPFTEETPPRPSDPYGVSKLEAERLVAEFGRQRGRSASSLRFPLVYGPGMRANMLRLFELVQRGIPLPFASVRNRRSLLYLGNAVAAIAAVLRKPGPPQPMYLVSDGDDVSSPELVRRIAQALGTRARLVAVPEWVFGVAGRGGDVIRRVAPWPLTSAAMARLTGSLAVDSSLLRDDLQLTMPYGMAAGLADTARWFRDSHARQGTAS